MKAKEISNRVKEVCDEEPSNSYSTYRLFHSVGDVDVIPTRVRDVRAFEVIQASRLGVLS